MMTLLVEEGEGQSSDSDDDGNAIAFRTQATAEYRRVTRIFIREGLTKFNPKKAISSDVLLEHKMSMRMH